MRRLPNVYPADTTAWPNREGTFDVGAAAVNSKILMRNLTPLNLRLDFYNGSTDILSAWEHNAWVLDGDTPTIGWSIDPDSPSVISPPSNVVYFTLFDANERVPGTYPVFSVLQTSEGTPGGVQANVTQLVNTGNVANTNVITANSTAAPGSTVTLSNDGLFQLLVTIAGALVNTIKTQEVEPVLQLGALTHLVEILGTLTIDQLATLSGGALLPNAVAIQGNDSTGTAHNLLSVLANNHVQIGPAGQGIDQVDGSGNIILRTTSTAVIANKPITATDTGNNILLGTGTNLQQAGLGLNAGGDVIAITQATTRFDTHLTTPGRTGTGSKIWAEPEGTQVMQWAADGTHLNSKPLFYVTGRVSRFDKMAVTAPAGTYPTSFTFTHGLGYTADFAWYQPGQLATASVGSCTTGVWNWTGTTTVVITLGAQINGQLFALKLDP